MIFTTNRCCRNGEKIKRNGHGQGRLADRGSRPKRHSFLGDIPVSPNSMHTLVQVVQTRHNIKVTALSSQTPPYLAARLGPIHTAPPCPALPCYCGPTRHFSSRHVSLWLLGVDRHPHPQRAVTSPRLCPVRTAHRISLVVREGVHHVHRSGPPSTIYPRLRQGL